jgi:hypothetical protein
VEQPIPVTFNGISLPTQVKRDAGRMDKIRLVETLAIIGENYAFVIPGPD